jgi:HEAT repeat protein
MKCQACDQTATHHVTEIAAGEPVEFHVCDEHLQSLEDLKPSKVSHKAVNWFVTFLGDPEFRKALEDADARQKVAAHQLPALCLALLDEKPEVRITAVFRLTQLGPDARSAAGALRDALQDCDERVRRAAAIALEWIESDPEVRSRLF